MLLFIRVKKLKEILKMSKSCVICGQPGYLYYPFCKEHLQMKSEGKIAKCEHCSQWHFANETCKCQKTIQFTELPTEGFNKCVVCGSDTIGYAFCKKCFKQYTTEEMLDILNNKTQNTIQENVNEKNKTLQNFFINDNDIENNNTVVIDFNNKSKCITCGKKTDGLLFCTSCYHKYKNKELLFKIKNCTNVELLEEGFEGKINCKDGHIVKSKAEFMIDDYLYSHNIIHAYEKGLPYGATEKEVLKPDFFLPNYLGKEKHVYIEYWGFNENNIQYTNTKKFKMDIYKKKHITLICVCEKDTHDIETSLDRKLNKEYIHENEINE